MRVDLKSRLRAAARVCSGAIMILLVIVALGPGKWTPRTELGWQFDHFIGYFGITLFVCIAWPRPLVVGGVLAVFGALLEGLQAFTPDRTANLVAALWGAGGALAAALVAEFFIQMRDPRGFVRYLVAVLTGVAAALAWQSYGDGAKQVIATNAPELGWSPGTKQMIAGWVQQLGWTKPPIGSEKQAAPVAQTAPETVVSKAPAVPSIDPAQVQQIARDLATLRQTVEQLAAGLDQVTRQIARLEAADVEILANITPAPPPPRSIAAAARKPAPVQPPSSRVPTAQPSSLAPMPPRQ